MRDYVHYLHFLDYCPHLCCHVYYVSAIVHSSLLQEVGMSIQWLDPVTYPKSVSSILSEGNGELSEGKLTGDN